MDPRTLCSDVETELRTLCQETRRKYPSIKAHAERAIVKVREYCEDTTKQTEFPVDDVLRALMAACDTFQPRLVIISISLVQRLLHHRLIHSGGLAIAINLLKEQVNATTDETVQLRVLQTLLLVLSPEGGPWLNEIVSEQVIQVFFTLHGSPNQGVHHTACAGLRQLAEYITSQAVQEDDGAMWSLEDVKPTFAHPVGGNLPNVRPAQPDVNLRGPALRTWFLLIQDLCVMSDLNTSTASNRYQVEASERMRRGSRTGFWLMAVLLPRPLCLELLYACIQSGCEVVLRSRPFFALIKQAVCLVILKNIRGCYDFPVLIRCLRLFQLIFRRLGTELINEMSILLTVVLDLTGPDKPVWVRCAALDMIKSIAEEPASLVLAHQCKVATPKSAFCDLVDHLGRTMHEHLFSTSNSERGNQCIFPYKGRLLHLMNEIEPPQLQATAVPSLAVENVLTIIYSLYALTLDGPEDAPHFLAHPLSDTQVTCMEMLKLSWGGLLSAISLLLHSMHECQDESFVTPVLKSMERLFCACAMPHSVELDAGKEACLRQLARYGLPHEAESSQSQTPLSAKQAMCLKASVDICATLGFLMGPNGWVVCVKNFDLLDKTLANPHFFSKASTGYREILRQSLQHLFRDNCKHFTDDVFIIFMEAISGMIQFMSMVGGTYMFFDAAIDICLANKARIHLVWESFTKSLLVALEDASADGRKSAVSGLSKVIASCIAIEGVNAQQMLLPLRSLLKMDRIVRKHTCEGLLSLLRSSGQALTHSAWRLVVEMVTLACQLEMKAVTSTVGSPKAGATKKDGKNEENSLGVVFMLVELIVRDFIDNVGRAEIPLLTQTVAEFAGYHGLGNNVSFSAVGYLWNIADALARLPEDEQPLLDLNQSDELLRDDRSDLWIVIFTELQTSSIDPRPEVRNCALKSLTSAMVSHSSSGHDARLKRLVSVLIDTLTMVCAEYTSADSNPQANDANFLVHHSRNTEKKQWGETVVLAVDGARRVLIQFSDMDPEAWRELGSKWLQEVWNCVQPPWADCEACASACSKALADFTTRPFPCADQAWALWQIIGQNIFMEEPHIPDTICDGMNTALGILLSGPDPNYSVIWDVIASMVSHPSFHLHWEIWELAPTFSGRQALWSRMRSGGNTGKPKNPVPLGDVVLEKEENAFVPFKDATAEESSVRQLTFMCPKRNALHPLVTALALWETWTPDEKHENEVFRFCESLCQSFLDPHVVFLDHGKIAMAYRAITAILLLVRRVLRQGLMWIQQTLLDRIVPLVLSSLGALGSSRITQFSVIGMWRISLECALILIHDTLPFSEGEDTKYLLSVTDFLFRSLDASVQPQSEPSLDDSEEFRGSPPDSILDPSLIAITGGVLRRRCNKDLLRRLESAVKIPNSGIGRAALFALLDIADVSERVESLIPGSLFQCPIGTTTTQSSASSLCLRSCVSVLESPYDSSRDELLCSLLERLKRVKLAGNSKPIVVFLMKPLSRLIITGSEKVRKRVAALFSQLAVELNK
eukprot:GEMP01000705.1.p1 GENE.GEMP01000705.1~~GEMP01000705.1.p1  ORF type:complete len:1512 (+),score=273.28 GEMP01000705.1:87-4622(+)